MKGSYSTAQIGLHWLIALLLPVQYLTGGSIERTHHAAHMGVTPSSFDLFQHNVHNYAGMLIGVLMGVRLLLRIMRPPAPQSPASWRQKAATALHHALYAAILVQAGLGFVTSYLWFGTAAYHVALAKIILLIVTLHFGAAAWHTLVLKDETLDRMIFPRRDPSSEKL
ncbi:cytochrome b561 protein (plasmid) [Rhizobium phaseoli]|uniref:cytochrome b n=1 Tax=Rhizobium phaseoli TaxID=396 RepID=UPI0007EBDBA4|nr:cytochrome b/b6 domain-containing protein [Rhizobium phaseoli]ANL49500.1 cytochrome b561 protein [Rhizobium phaseoli]ANL74843.1 cytochrome b561 protein [Rhizobium phaseoli]